MQRRRRSVPGRVTVTLRPGRHVLILSAAAMFGMGLTIVALLEITQQAQERRSAAEIGYQFAEHLKEQFSNALSATYALSAVVHQGKGTVRDFQSLALEVLKLYPGIDAIQLAPGGIIREVVPLAGHEAALGHDLLKPDIGNREARLALETRQLTLAGPFQLRQGGDAIIGRLPVFLTDATGQDRFWGFTIVLIRLPRILAAAQFERLEEAGYNYELWRANPDSGHRQIIVNSRSPLVGPPVTTAVDVPNGQWMLGLTPARGWYSGTRIALGTAVATLLTAAFAAMLNAYLRNRQRAWDSAESYRRLFDNVQEAVHICSSDARLLAVNPAAARLYGRSQEWLAGRPLSAVAAPGRNDFESLLGRLRESLVGTPQRADFWGLDIAGQPFQLELNLVRSNYRSEPAVIAVGRDVTERARVARRERMRTAILERIASGGTLAEILEALARDVEQESTGTLCSILLRDDTGTRLRLASAPSLPTFYNEAVDGVAIGAHVGSCGAAAFLRQRVVVENIAEHPNWVGFRAVASRAGLASCWSEPICGRKDQVLGSFAIYHRDPGTPQPDDVELITHAARLAGIAIERDADQRALRESEARFRALIEGASDAFFAHDLDGTLVEVNQAACDSAGYRRDQLLAQRIPELFEEGGALEDRPHWEALQPGQSITVRSRQRRSDGSAFPVEIRLSACDLGGQRLILRLSRDITERVRSEAELERYRHHLETRVAERTAQLHSANARLEAASRAKSTFLANMSHEIRTPMNAILGLTHLMLSKSTRPEEQGRLGRIAEAAQHLLSIINDILDISKIEADKLQLEENDFRLQEAFDYVSALIAEKARDKGLTWEALIEPEVNGPLRGDGFRLRQILLNLVSNALKFTERGSIRLRAEQVGNAHDGVTVRFEVADTGIGIAREQQGRLFNAFEQSDNSITRNYGGTGLGLAICKRLAELMGGHIGVDSELDRGSVFWFTAHFGAAVGAAPKPAPTADAEYTAEAVARLHSGAHLLLVEDNRLSREVALELLADCGLTIDTAENGLQAVAMARTTDYHAVLMDLQMPVLDGIEATRRIRGIPGRERTPILAMTANAFDTDRDACLAAGMNEHLSKPIIPATLYAALLRWLSPRPPAPAAAPAAQTPAARHPETTPDFGPIAGLDIERGLDHLGGNLSSYRRMLRLFAERAPRDLQALRAALAERGDGTARRIAHTIKGTAATLGATTVATVAARLEAALHDGEPQPRLDELIDAVAQTYSTVAASIIEGLDRDKAEAAENGQPTAGTSAT
ncbi:PAS domain S-box protein [Methylolobus aquaticus]